MSWLGANEILISKEKTDLNSKSNNGRSLSHSKRNPRFHQETIEAALNRINKSYAVAMECFSALLKADADNMIKQNSAVEVLSNAPGSGNTVDPSSKLNEIIRVANAARNVFENSILLDPLISNQHSTTLKSTLLQIESEYINKYVSVKSNETKMNSNGRIESVEETVETRTQLLNRPVTLTSTGHKSMVQQIAYLALINYADLLMMGLSKHQIHSIHTKTILDRGVIRCLKSLDCQNHEDINQSENQSSWRRIFHVTRKTRSRETKKSEDKNIEDGPCDIMKISTNIEQNDTFHPCNTSVSTNHKTNDTHDVSNLNTGVEHKEESEKEDLIDKGASDNVATNINSSNIEEDLVKKDETNLVDKTIDHRGATDKLLGRCVDTVKYTTRSELVDELETDTVRLALVAYLDATSIDGSDPTVWIKLACAARRLGRLSSLDVSHNESATYFLRYHRLEKHALEKAVSCLGPNEVPNRTAVRALAEWEKENGDCDTYVPIIYQDIRSETEFQVDVPSYSWHSLAITLLTLCKEGKLPYHGNGKLPKRTKTQYYEIENNVSSSENIRLRISPLFGLPKVVVVCLSSFLDRNEIKLLKSTCRTLMASIIDDKTILNAPSAESIRNTVFMTQHPNVAEGLNAEKGKDPSSTQEVVSRGDTNISNAKRASRVSNRVKSQMMASEKEAERERRRQSIDYCLLGAALGCTNDDRRYHALVSQNVGKHVAYASNLQRKRNEETNEYSNRVNLSTLDKTDVGSYNDNYSLAQFVDKWKGRSVSSATAVLFSFVAHAALHVTAVFIGDSGGRYSLMATKQRAQQSLLPSWQVSTYRIPRDSTLTRIDLFALDLLHCELRLKRCEQEEELDLSFDGDSNFLSLMIPHLLGCLANFEQSRKEQTSYELWLPLKVRCLWLSSSFYLWRSKISSNVSESREAEREGLHYIDEVMKCLNDPNAQRISIIRTPHLESPKRKGKLWNELSSSTLASFSCEIMASSIVLQAQELYLEAITKLGGRENELEINENDIESLYAIGESLLNRYAATADDSSSKHSELLDNLLSVHGPSLLILSESRDSTDTVARLKEWFNSIVPVGPIDKSFLFDFSNQCILTILIICIQMKSGKMFDIVQLIYRILVTTIERYEHLHSSIHEDTSGTLWSTALEGFNEVDDAVSNNNESTSPDGMVNKSIIRFKMRQCTILVVLLTEKIEVILQKHLNNLERLKFTESPEFVNMIHRILFMAKDWFQAIGPTALDGSTTEEDFFLLFASKALIKASLEVPQLSNVSTVVTVTYIKGLMQLLDIHRRLFDQLAHTKPSVKGRSTRLRATRRRADMIAEVSCEIGSLLSMFPFFVEDWEVKRSPLLCSLSDSDLAGLIDNVLELWRIASGTESRESHLGAYLDTFGRDRLKVPLAVCIVGLCGAAISTFRTFPLHSDESTLESGQILLSEFYDSDSSAFDLLKVEDEEAQRVSKKEELLRVVMQSVYCINALFCNIPEADMVEFTFVRDYVSSSGPVLPLIIVRVLNRLSSCLLLNFAVKKQRPLWETEYPFGTLTTGRLLDSILHKAYKCLHGFSLTSLANADIKDTPLNSGPLGNSKRNYFPPEDTNAAIMLYRCVMRSYSVGRKSPPKAALDCILEALPEGDVTKESKAIHQYLFSQINVIQMDDLSSIVTNDGNSCNTFSFVENIVTSHSEKDSDVNEENEIMTVRRGVSSLIAQGPLPQYQDSGNLSDARLQCTMAEEELSRKFISLFDDLCLNNVNNFEGWHKACQCLVLRAELIADRIGLSKGYARNENFFVDKGGARPVYESYSTQDMEDKQEQEARLRREGWVYSLGNDLSFYVRYNWSSLGSLQQLSSAVGKIHLKLMIESEDEKNDEDVQMRRFEALMWKGIDEAFVSNDIVGWQQAWGGIFVSSLRQIALRCLCLSLFVAFNQKNWSQNKLLIAEIIESLGTMVYVELHGSQTYGYPMHVTPDFMKRQQSFASLVCFERAVTLMNEGGKVGNDARVTWDLFFMIGKCHEKLAKTFRREKVTSVDDGSDSKISNATRKYEYHMIKALNSYQTAVAEALEMEKNGDFGSEQDGGSNHGATEAIYRLHASRLKCLIGAVSTFDNSTCAEEEALRITESHWYSAPDEEPRGLSVRERIWRVFSDIVTALARCRLDNAYFHRSVYRHAQALMWAPILHDPVGGRAAGSLGTVPSTWAFKLRGLNHATNAASSAVVVISSLFEKKRSQLCAVWVTESSSMTVFQTLNSSIRKYDSLRAKYISAYVDSLRLCTRSKELETLLRWIYSSQRDLPSYFAATAETLDDKTKQPHVHDTLVIAEPSIRSLHFLTTLKRMTNEALACVELQEVNDTKEPLESELFLSRLRIIYACFLRLNCEQTTLIREQTYLIHQRHGVKQIADALTSVYLRHYKVPDLSIQRTEWGMESNTKARFFLILAQCKKLFPNISGNYFSIKKVIDTKSRNETLTEAKSHAPTKTKSFDLPEPEGLLEGETIVTNVTVADSVKKVLPMPDDGVTPLSNATPVPEDELNESQSSGKKRKMRDV